MIKYKENKGQIKNNNHPPVCAIILTQKQTFFNAKRLKKKGRYQTERERYKNYSLPEYLLRNSGLQEISGLPQLSEKTESIAKLDFL